MIYDIKIYITLNVSGKKKLTFTYFFFCKPSKYSSIYKIVQTQRAFYYYNYHHILYIYLTNICIWFFLIWGRRNCMGLIMKRSGLELLSSVVLLSVRSTSNISNHYWFVALVTNTDLLLQYCTSLTSLCIYFSTFLPLPIPSSFPISFYLTVYLYHLPLPIATFHCKIWSLLNGINRHFSHEKTLNVS